MGLLYAKSFPMTALGGDFKKARESRCLPLSEVAESLHIRGEFLDAIESERWEVVGDPVSLRGLLRTYARFLGLDGSAIIERFNSEHTSSPSATKPRPKSSFDAKAFAAFFLGVVAILTLCFTLSRFAERLRLHHVLFVVRATPTPGPASQLEMTLVATPMVEVTGPGSIPSFAPISSPELKAASR